MPLFVAVTSMLRRSSESSTTSWVVTVVRTTTKTTWVCVARPRASSRFSATAPWVCMQTLPQVARSTLPQVSRTANRARMFAVSCSSQMHRDREEVSTWLLSKGWCCETCQRALSSCRRRRTAVASCARPYRQRPEWRLADVRPIPSSTWSVDQQGCHR